VITSKYMGDFLLVGDPVDGARSDTGITLKEWREVIANDPTLESVDVFSGRNPITGEKIRIPIQGGARWMKNHNGVSIPFSWEKGRIVCQGLDEAAFAKVKELAGLLHADGIEDDS
jgi:hypothetical protein